MVIMCTCSLLQDLWERVSCLDVPDMLDSCPISELVAVLMWFALSSSQTLKWEGAGAIYPPFFGGHWCNGTSLPL